MAQTPRLEKSPDPAKDTAMQTAGRARHDRRAIAALFAVFALLTQALMPAAAMAAPADSALSLICTAGGHATVPDAKAAQIPGGPHKGFAGMPCQDCLAAAMAAVMTSPVTVRPVAYRVAAVVHAPDARPLAPRARGPPRPLGQGPPTA